MTLNKLINNSGFKSFIGILKVLTFLNPINNNKTHAGNPIITLKLKGGITSIATLNNDQTELHTKTNKIRRITGMVFFEKNNSI